MIELFSQGDREYFAIEGVHNLPSHFRQLESEVRKCQLKETTPLADDLMKSRKHSLRKLLGLSWSFRDLGLT